MLPSPSSTIMSSNNNNNNNENNNTTPVIIVEKPCNACGKDSKTTCSQCKGVHYCDRTCQKQDWKQHKPFCFPPDSTCTRCLEKIIPGSKCQIPHPDHLQEGTGSMLGSNRAVQNFYCKACESSYTRSSSGPDCLVAINEIPITKGKKWCFQGNHTIKPLESGDDRRICNDVVVLTTGDDLQTKLNQLDGNEAIRVLKLKSSDAFWDSDNGYELNIRLPNLEEFQSVDVNVTKLVLTPDYTPKMKKLFMQNPTDLDDPAYDIRCPEMRDISISYWGPGNFRWVVTMLESATKLETFDSYKLRVEYLKFASNELQSIRLHRAELLGRIDIWAPQLVNLNVQAAYDLEEIHFLKDHPLKKEWKGSNCNKELVVNAMNACLGPQAIRELQSHPRVNARAMMDSMEDDDY